MRRPATNPIGEAAIYAIGGAAGIAIGTVLATYLVETMRANGTIPTPASPSSPSTTLPPRSYDAL